MVSYKCKRCKKIFTRKTDFERHKTRKYSCERIQGEENDTLYKEPLGAGVEVALSAAPKQEPVVKEKLYTCRFCDANFTRKSNLYRHKRNTCVKNKSKSVQESDNLTIVEKNDTEQKNKEDMQELLKGFQEIKETLAKIQGNTTNNVSGNIENQQINNNNNKTINNDNKTVNNQTINNNSFTMVAFGYENLNDISEDACKRMLNKGFMSVPKLIEHVHFHEQKPEQHNIYIPNLRDKHAAVYDGSDWFLKPIDEIIEQLFNDKQEYLIGSYKKLYKTLNKSTKRKFGNFLKEHKDEDIIKQKKYEIKMILYNKRKLPETTRENMKTMDVQEFGDAKFRMLKEYMD